MCFPCLECCLIQMPGALPPAGVEFPVHLGSSFGAEGSEGPGLCLLQYHFKPASAGRLRTGQIKLQPEHQQVRPALQEVQRTCICCSLHAQYPDRFKSYLQSPWLLSLTILLMFQEGLIWPPCSDKRMCLEQKRQDALRVQLC